MYSLFRESECHTSPAGYMLTAASKVPRMCRAGTFSAAGASSCSTTSEYYYTPSGASTDLEEKCPWGFYCYDDFGTQKEVPVSTKGTASVGYYLPSVSYTVTNIIAEMIDCDAGYYCPFGLMKRYPCPAGHYCPAGSELPTACPAGYFNIHIM